MPISYTNPLARRLKHTLKNTLKNTLQAAGLLALTLSLVAPAMAQDWKGRGRLTGKVKNTAGEPIKDAQIHIFYRGQEGIGPKPVKTNKKGRWAYMGLTSGPYTLVVEAEGFVSAETQTNLNEYATAPPTPIEVELRPAEASPSEESDRLMGLVNQGNLLLQEGKFVEARVAFEEVLAAIEEDAQKRPLLIAVAGTYLEEGNTEEARTRFASLIASTEDPAQKVSLMQSVARSYYMDENIDKSVETLEQALVIVPDDPGTVRRIVDTLLAAGREQDAEPYMDKLPEGEKIDPNALLNLGIGAYNSGDMEAALEKFQKVVQSYPDNADAFYYLGLVHMGKEENAKAIESFDKMLSLQPEHPSAGEAQQFLDYLKSL